MSKFIDMTGWIMSEHGVSDSKWTIIQKVDAPQDIKDKHNNIYSFLPEQPFRLLSP